mgnify:CR=1 FL=1
MRANNPVFVTRSGSYWGTGFSLFVWYCVQFTRFYAILPNWGEQLKLSLHHWVLSANRGFGQWTSDRFLSINQSIRRSSQNVARQLFIFRSLSVVFTASGSVHEILYDTSDWFWDTYLIKPKKSHRIWQLNVYQTSSCLILRVCPRDFRISQKWVILSIH